MDGGGPGEPSGHHRCPQGHPAPGVLREEPQGEEQQPPVHGQQVRDPPPPWGQPGDSPHALTLPCPQGGGGGARPPLGVPVPALLLVLGQRQGLRLPRLRVPRGLPPARGAQPRQIPGERREQGLGGACGEFRGSGRGGDTSSGDRGQRPLGSGSNRERTRSPVGSGWLCGGVKALWGRGGFRGISALRGLAAQLDWGAVGWVQGVLGGCGVALGGRCVSSPSRCPRTRR